MKILSYVKLSVFFTSIALLFLSCSKESNGGVTPVDPPVVDGGGDVALLVDGKRQTEYKAQGSNISIVLNNTKDPLVAYSIYSGAEDVSFDPQSWVVKGSNDGTSWEKIDEQNQVSFAARYQRSYFVLLSAARYKKIRFEMQPKGGKELHIGEIELLGENPNKGWEAFVSPSIIFSDEAPSSLGSKFYSQMVQDKKVYLQYHALEVAKLLYFSDKDKTSGMNTLRYVIKDYDGISAKSGNPPAVTIEFSTRHIERSFQESLFKLDYETRGVLFHELTHAYQLEPKGIGTYADKIFWSIIEGMADAVRIQAGFVDFKDRRPGGDYRDGYKTTGFFIQWMTTKDPDAIRKMNASMSVLNPWSYDGAVKYIFGEQATVSTLWNEYQAYLNSLK